MNEGIEALQWTQGSSKEFNDLVAISYHAYTYSITSPTLTIKKFLIMALVAPWHVKKKIGEEGGGGGGGWGGFGKLCVPLEKSWLRPCNAITKLQVSLLE